MMQQYYGTKNLNAKPMTRGEYNSFRGWETPLDEERDDAGYLVEYLDGGKANHPDFAGYISWSPKDVFEAAYQPTDALSFGHALVALKAGKAVARAGWNGKGMFVWLNKGSLDISSPAEYFVAGVSSTLFGCGDKGTTTRFPNLNMRAAGGETVTGWLASQTDMLANDWQIVEITKPVAEGDAPEAA